MDVKFCIEDEHLRVQYTPAEEILQAEFGEITEIPLTSIRVDQTADGAKVTAATNEFVTTAVILNGKDGKSAYQIAVENGFDGTEEEWVASLKGGLGQADAEQVEQIITDYLEKNPIEGVTPEQVDQAVESALQQAKESGEFDGEPGKTPVKGTDYFTEADKAEMVADVIAALPVYGGETA
jgi:hypothetical protein